MEGSPNIKNTAPLGSTNIVDDYTTLILHSSPIFQRQGTGGMVKSRGEAKENRAKARR